MLNLLYPKEFARDPDYNSPPVAHEVPLATIRDHCYVLTDGSLATVFRIDGMVGDLVGGRDFVQFSEALRGVLNTIPTKVQFSLIHRITHNYRDWLEAHDDEINGNNAFARYVAWDQARRYWQAMDNEQLLRSENLVVLTYNPKVHWWEATNRLEAFKGALFDLSENATMVQRSAEEYQLAIRKFEQVLRPVVNQMVISDLNPRRLDDDDLKELAWEVLNPTLARRQGAPDISPPSWRDPHRGVFSDKKGKKAAASYPEATIVAPVSEREALSASDWVVGDKWVRIDDTYFAALYLKMLPTAVYPSMALRLAQLPFQATIRVDALMLAKEQELEKQWKRTRSDESKAGATIIGGTPDPKEQEQASEKRKQYLQMAAAHENPFQYRMVVVVSGQSPEELEQRCEAVATIARSMESTDMRREHYGVHSLIKSTWPFSPPTDVHARKALTSQIANLLPVFRRWDGSTRPVTLFMDRQSRLVKHDPFPVDQLNRNKILCGKSGSGKSFAAQLADIQPHAARDNTEILLVESGGSFELTTRCFGGTNIKLGPSSDLNINPFDLPPGFHEMTEEQQEVELRYKYGFIKNLIMSMVNLPDPESQMLAENVIGTVSQRTYKQVQGTPRFRDFYRILGQYRNENDPRAEEVASRLRTLLANYVVTEGGEAGIYSQYFDTYTNFDSDTPIICFDLIDIKNDPGLLIPITMVVILGLIYNRLMKRDGKERLVVVDEAWALIKEDEKGQMSPAGEGLQLFWREGRKLGASSAMISQNFSDMTEDTVGRAVVGNSPIQYFLVHEAIRANDDAFKSANFTKSKIDAVYNLSTKYGEYSEIMIKEGDEWGIVRLPSAGIKYWLATTDPKDLDVRRRYMQTYQQGYGLDEKVVIAILAHDYPGGVHQGSAGEMSEQEALQYAEQWSDHFERFSELVERGERVPPDFV